MPNNGYFDTVFASTGDVTPIPDAAQLSGTVSYAQGYTPPYSLAPTNPSAILVGRAQFNQIIKDVTTAIQFQQQNGASNFITTLMNGGVTPYSYNLGATVMYDAGSGLQGWLSTANANTTTPGAMGAHWSPLTSTSGRTALTANTTFYVSSSGNDSTGNGTVGAPWLTIQHALSVLQDSYDLAGFQALIQWGGGTNTGNVAVVGPFVGQAGHTQVVIDGAGATFNCSSNAFYAGEAAAFTVQNITFTGNTALVAANLGVIAVGAGINFGACSGNHMYNSPGGGQFIITAAYTISGGAAAHIQLNGPGSAVLYESSGAVTLTGTPNFSGAFANVNSGAGLYFSQTPTFSGAATGVRYAVSVNGTINTQGSGATYLPGNSAGTTATGGVYA